MASAKAGSLMSDVDFDQLDAGAGRPGAHCVEQPVVRVWIGERAAGGVDRRHATQGKEHAGRPSGCATRCASSGAEFGVLLRCRAHQRDAGVVLVQVRPRNCEGTVSSGPKLTMSSAPAETTCGTPPAPRRQPIGPGVEHAADEIVGQFGGRDVQHSGEDPCRHSDSIACPPDPVMWKTSTS